jgi:hypothetical protein
MNGQEEINYEIVSTIPIKGGLIHRLNKLVTKQGHNIKNIGFFVDFVDENNQIIKLDKATGKKIRKMIEETVNPKP